MVKGRGNDEILGVFEVGSIPDAKLGPFLYYTAKQCTKKFAERERWLAKIPICFTFKGLLACLMGVMWEKIFYVHNGI